MKKTKCVGLLALLATMFNALPMQAEGNKVVAIFIANRAGAELDSQVPVFEDFVTAKITGLGFEVLSREIVIDAVGGLLSGHPENSLDALLNDQTSALRLSQNLNADYLLFASLAGFDKETRAVDAYGVNFTNEIHTLRATYRILDGNTGGSLVADSVNPSRTIQQSQHSRTSAPGLVRELLDKASVEIAQSLRQKDAAATLRTVELQQEEVEFQITVSLSDVNFPEVVIDDKGQVRVTANQATVQPLAVAVDLDGFTIGSTGDGGALTTLRASPGIHRLRLSRADLVTVERMVNIRPGLRLNISMQLNEEGRQRWLENTVLLNSLKRDAVLTAAEAEALRGLAQMLRQSGFKVDTDRAPTIEHNQSLMRNN